MEAAAAEYEAPPEMTAEETALAAAARLLQRPGLMCIVLYPVLCHSRWGFASGTAVAVWEYVFAYLLQDFENYDNVIVK